MNTIYIMCGLPGSGKTTTALNILKENKNALWVSSDSVREGLYGSEEIQGNPKEVFTEVDRLVQKALDEGHDVVYDATNISKATRRNIMNKFDAEYICVYCNAELDTCIQRNDSRIRKVPHKVIKRMYKNFEEPTIDEGYKMIMRAD